jgi:N-acetylglucosaminyldiphosphoundecaprenol N-acetyl-beta-D-mannosaminyltransferase
LTQKLGDTFPGLKIAGAHSPPFRQLSPEEDAEEVRKINQSGADVVWVGLGLPKQERWMFEHRDKLEVPVLVGVGAAFKFLSGQVRRAPVWVGDHGLEWAWRFIQEPRRVWRRVLIDGPRFGCHVALELSGLKKYE